MRSFVALVGAAVLLGAPAARANIASLNSQRVTTGVPIDPAKQPVSRPICVAHAWADDKILLSQHYPSGNPYSFYVIEQDGGLTPWGTNNGLRGEIMLDTVPENNAGGYVPGDIFTGNGVDGQVMRVTNSGQTTYRNWCNLRTAAQQGGTKPDPGGIGLLRGALHFDRFNPTPTSWNNELVIAGTSGKVFRVAAGDQTCGTVTYLGNTGGRFLEGMTILPPNTTRWGRFAGAALFGAEQQGDLWVFWADGRKENINNVGARIEDLDLVPESETGSYYFVNYGRNSIYAVPYTEFAGHGGKLIANQESGAFWEIRLNTATDRLQAYRITMNGYPGGSLEQATFSFAGVNEILPADFSLCMYNGGGAPIKPLQFPNNKDLTAISNYQYQTGTRSARATMIGRPNNDELRVFFMQDARNQFSLAIMTGTLSAPATFSVEVKALNGAAQNPLGAGVRALVQDDPDDSIVVNAVGGTVAADFTAVAGETDGMVIGPIDFVPMTTLIEFEITVTVTSGSLTTTVGTYNDQTDTMSSTPFTSPLMLVRKHCNCGDGVIERAEQCDPGTTPNPCCVDCQFSPASTKCRDNADLCDLDAFCPGDSAVCPPNPIVPATPKVQCGLNASTSLCTYCDGVNAACPSPAGPAQQACPTCNSLNNCTGNGACSGTPLQCTCATGPPAYTGPTCSTPACSTLTDCGSCSAHPECGWCCSGSNTTGVCVQANLTANAPLNPLACPAPSVFQKETASCTCASPCQNGGSCECGTCQCVPPYGGPTCTEEFDCNGVLGGPGVYGVCGCDKGDTACLGCDGVPFGKIVDACGVCGGDGTSCYNPCDAPDCNACFDLEDCIYCVDEDGKEECIPESSSRDKCDQEATNIAGCAALGVGLEEEEAAAIAGGVIAAIIIGAVAACVLLAGGGYGGYRALEKYRGNVSGAASNPLYEDKVMAGSNPLAEDEPSLLVGVNA